MRDKLLLGYILRQDIFDSVKKWKSSYYNFKLWILVEKCNSYLITCFEFLDVK